MTGSLATVALLVRDYDEAIRFFTQALGFELLEDEPRPTKSTAEWSCSRIYTATAGTC